MLAFVCMATFLRAIYRILTPAAYFVHHIFLMCLAPKTDLSATLIIILQQTFDTNINDLHIVLVFEIQACFPAAKEA